MSDITSLSHEYSASADFAQKANDALLLLKKETLAEKGLEMPSTSSLKEARQILMDIAKSILNRLGEGGVSSYSTSLYPIPEDIFTRIESQHRGRIPYFLDDFKRIFKRLSKNVTLEEQDLVVLDAICQAADASASASFRRLRRR